MHRALLLLLSTALIAQDKPRLQEPWQTGYTKEDSTGAHVLGHWKFDGDEALKDNSGKGNDLSDHGAKLVSNGKFEGAIESFPGFPVEDKSHGLHTALRPKLSPTGAFTMEMWIKPKADFKPETRCYLLDKKYVDHTDYQWTIGSADKGGSRRMTVTLGFGSDSKAWNSDAMKLAVGEWHHVAFIYDGAGTGRFLLNGQSAGTMHHDGCTSIAPGVKPLCIGDRLGSNYGGFPGFIDEVRICNGELNFEQVSLRIETNRHALRRMEAAKTIQVIATNLKRSTLSGAKLRLSFGGKEEVIALKDLLPGKEFIAPFTINTTLKPDRYTLRARLELDDYATERSDVFDIVPRLAPRMPVVMWGAGPDDVLQLRDIGFTHCAGIGGDTSETWSAKKPMPPGKPEQIAKRRDALDEALRHGLSVFASLSPKEMPSRDPAYLRADSAGKPYERQDIDALNPDLPPFFENVGKSIAKAYGDHPAFDAALINTEVRDNTAVSYNSVDVEAYRKFAGVDRPKEAVAKWGVDYTKLKDFPADRVIADDDPILKFYRWFWTVGDGWNALHSSLSKGVKTNNSDVWTWFDPAVRQPSISGAGGSVDVLSHWTYTYPNPLCIGLAADQLFAMSAASGRNQKVMKMTQLIWYRSQTAPIGQKAPGDTIAWEDHDPDAAYITIAPMHLKEAFWTKIARPIQGIMYHGWQSLVNDPTNTGAYRFTNPNTVHVLRELIHQVIEPLGPTLLQVPDEKSEVAVLESFTSQMFARRGGYGSNNNWAADLWLALQHAHVQCDVIFEETLLKSGLYGRKYLLMPECDVLPRAVVDKIAAWQKKGGKVIADEFLCPGIKADLVINSHKRTKKADADKTTVLADAAKLTNLGLPRKADCDNPEIIVRTRKFGDATYVFAVNDKREFGTYVGQHGLVMENGLPSSGVITLPLDSANVYDLTTGRLIVPNFHDNLVSWPVELGPCDGRIFLILPRPLTALKVAAPEIAKQGNQAKLEITLNDSKQLANAVLPVQVEVRDANGKPAEGTGYYAAKAGALTLPLDIASNDDPGTWEIRVRDLVTRTEVVKFIRVEK